MLAALPLLMLLALWITFSGKASLASRLGGIRRSFLAAAICWAAFLVLTTEVLTLFRIVSPGALALTWGLGALVLLWLAWRNGALLAAFSTGRQRLKSVRLSGIDGVLLAGIFGYLVVLLVIGLAAPPNTNDSLSYHMSRVMHWVQNQSLAHYSTPINRQIWMPPWAELAILQFVVLAGSDVLANLVQWLSMVGCLVGVSLIAGRLGASTRGQILAAVFCLTLPMGILQATSTQNDYVLAFWTVCLASFALEATRRPLNTTEWVLTGLVVGLGILTKGTFYAYALPFLGLLLVVTWRGQGWRTVGKFIALGAALTLLINIGFWSRNFQTYRFPLGPEDLVDHHTTVAILPGPLISNLTRNLTLHLSTPVEEFNDRLVSLMEGLHQVLRQDINADETTLGEYDVFWGAWHEDFAGNPLHLFLIPVSLAFLGRPRRQEPWKTTWLLAGLLLATFLLFSIAYKWQPWGSRLQLPFFVLWSPVFGVALGRAKPGWVGLAAYGLLILSGLPLLMFNRSRPLISWEVTNTRSIFTTPRNEALFTNANVYRRGYTSVTAAVTASGCQEVGLRLNSREPEYPYWALMSAPFSGRTIRSLDTDPPLNQYHPPDFQPCAIICTRCADFDTLYGLELAGVFENNIRLYLQPELIP